MAEIAGTADVTGAIARRPTLADRLARYERPLKAFGKLASVSAAFSVIAWLFGSLVSYNSWRQDYDLKQFQEDLDHATATFSEASQALSTAITLQEMLVFNVKDAVALAPDNDVGLAFLSNQSKAVNDDYVKTRTNLRETIELLARKVQIYIDWPSYSDKNDLVSKAGLDPLTMSSIGAADIDCDKIAVSASGRTPVREWGKQPASTKPGAPEIDWQSAKHHIMVIYTCFAQDHTLMEPIREWAANPSKPTDAQKARIKSRVSHLAETRLPMQLERLKDLMVLFMVRIDQIRGKNAPPSYLCHLLGYGCGNSKA